MGVAQGAFQSADPCLKLGLLQLLQLFRAENGGDAIGFGLGDGVIAWWFRCRLVAAADAGRGQYARGSKFHGGMHGAQCSVRKSLLDSIATIWYDVFCIKSRADALANLPARARWPTETVSVMRSRDS